MALKYLFNPFSGKFDLVDISDSAPPVFLAAGSTFNVPRYKQIVFETVIDCEGVIDLDGILAEAK